MPYDRTEKQRETLTRNLILLDAFRIRLGRDPKPPDVDAEPTIPSYSYFRKRYGTLAHALEAGRVATIQAAQKADDDAAAEFRRHTHHMR